MSSAEIREGFLCPMCMQDLGTVSLLQNHFEEEHSEDKDVLYQLKGLFDKAKRRILKKEREEDVGTASYGREEKAAISSSINKETFTTWAAQELGATRLHTDYFKRMRDTRIDRCVIETNKLLIRMDKLLGTDLPSDPGKRKETCPSGGLMTRAFDKAKSLASVTENAGKMAKSLFVETRVEYDEEENPYEKAVVPWAADSDVQACPTCEKRFTLTRRRHHCRLCGGIMCNKCSQFLPFEYAKKLTNPAFQYEGTGFHRSNSSSSLNSMFSPEGDMHIRTCVDCRTLLERRDQQMEQRKTKPLLVQLYEKMKKNIVETDKLLKYFLKMSYAIRTGETTYSLDDANLLRVKIMKLYESIDSLSKRIMNLGTDNPLQPPSVLELQLQNKIRLYARNYLQEHLMGLQALPTADEYEQLKEARRLEIKKKIEAEKLAAAERTRLVRLKELRDYREQDKNSAQSQRPVVLDVQGHRRQGSQGFVQDEGWKPSEVTHGPVDDPMVQQMNIIKGYIKQAKDIDRWDEVKTLELNLKELQQVYWLEKEKAKHSSESKRKTNPNVTETSSSITHSKESSPKIQGQIDPILQQIDLIKGYIKQAKENGRWDEVHIFEQNLLELQQTYRLEKEKLERSSFQSPLQSNISLPTSHQDPQVSAKSNAFSSQSQQQMYSNQSTHNVQRHGDVQMGAKPKQHVTTPTSMNPFDEDYNEAQVKAYMGSKQTKRYSPTPSAGGLR